MIDDLFCQECGKIKRRCVCGKESLRKKNLKLFESSGSNESLKPLFNTEDEIILCRVFQPYSPNPEVPADEIGLPLTLQKALKDSGITHLYNFQKKAIDLIRAGKNVVITAPTGFGKTEAFIIPVIEKVAECGTGLIIYPTKALARDQDAKIKKYASSFGLNVVRFDGDSGQEERRAVFSGKANIILSNPDMIDYHLRNTYAFREIISDVQIIVVDELHCYNGLFGSNMHYLVKRLSRLADFQIACASATISNAREFAEELFERKFEHAHGKHRKGVMNLIMRYTPSVYAAIKDILRSIPGRKTLVFCNSYKSVETASWILNREGIRARVHKSGLPTKVREEVEREFKEGKLNVVVSTPTLELGVDIGDVDAVVSELINYPGFIQRVGRAGRMGQESIGVLLLREDDSISTYYRSNPEEYLEEENFGYIEKMNEEVLKFQIVAMCMEKPLSRKEVLDEWKNTVKWLIDSKIIFENRGYLLPANSNFLKNFSMRGIADSIKMVSDGQTVGERVLPVAIKELFPGSVLIHNGRRYRSLSLDLDAKEALLEEYKYGREITGPLYNSVPRITGIEEVKDAVYCSLEITLSVYGYIERDMFSGEKKNAHHIKPVSYTFPTKGFLFSAPFPEYLEYEDYYAGTFHALEHVLIESSNALTGGGSNQIGGISTPEGDIFVYDGTVGGSGLSKLLFKRLGRGLQISYEVLKNCDCERIDGCPRCTYSYQCGNNNQPLNKIGALKTLEIILKGLRREANHEKYREVVNFKYYP
jgi:DEAD/DEAH box helicase domain-containing protein